MKNNCENEKEILGVEPRTLDLASDSSTTKPYIQTRHRINWFNVSWRIFFHLLAINYIYLIN